MNTHYVVQHALSVDVTKDGSWFGNEIHVDHARDLPRIGETLELGEYSYQVTAVFHHTTTEYAPGRVLVTQPPTVRVK